MSASNLIGLLQGAVVAPQAAQTAPRPEEDDDDDTPSLTPTQVQQMIVDKAQAIGVPPNIALSLAQHESGFDPDAESPDNGKGRGTAKGVYQLIDSTAKNLGVSDSFDPEQNIAAGLANLKANYDKFGSWDLAVAAHQAGAGAVAKAGGIPGGGDMNISTKDYVNKIMGDAGSQPAIQPRVSLTDMLAGKGGSVAPLQASPSQHISLTDLLSAAVPDAQADTLDASGNLPAIPAPASTPGVSDVLTGLRTTLGRSMFNAVNGLQTAYADWSGDTDGANAAIYDRQLADQVPNDDPHFSTKLGNMLYQGAAGAASAAPALAVGSINPYLGMTVAAAQSGGEEYGTIRARGGSAGQAALGGTLDAGIAAATGMMPMGFLSSKLGQVGMGEFVTGLIARDVPSMVAQTVASDMVDTSIANPQRTWGDFTKQLPSNIAQAAVSALVFASAASAAHGVANRFKPADAAAPAPSAEPRPDLALVPQGQEAPIAAPNSGADPVDAISKADNVDDAISAYQAAQPKMAVQTPLPTVDMDTVNNTVAAIDAQHPANDPMLQANELLKTPNWQDHKVAQPPDVRPILDNAEQAIQSSGLPDAERADIAQKVMDYANNTPSDAPVKQAAPVEQVEQPVAQLVADRRVDSTTRAAMENMTPDEIHHALFTSALTDLPNYRAFKTERAAAPGDHVAFSDLDDFKGLNDKLGHEGVDEHILPAVGAIKAQVAAEMGVAAYHRSGDEFLATHPDPATLEAYGKAVQDRLAKTKFSVTRPDGSVAEHEGVGLSYGVGRNEESAESNTVKQKAERKAAGLRTGARDNGGVPGETTARESVDQGNHPAEAAEVNPVVAKALDETEAEKPPARVIEPQGKVAYTYPGMYKKGMTERNARNEAARRNRTDPELIHTAEPVEGLEHPYQVVGRERVAPEATMPDPRYQYGDTITRANRDENLDPLPEEAKRVQDGIEGKPLLDAARWIADNAPPEHQLIADKVLNTLGALQKAGVKLSLNVAHSGDMVPIALTNAGARGITHYSFDPKNPFMKVWLNGADLKGKVGTSHEIVLHELVHAATMGAVRLGNTRASIGSEVSRHVKDLYDVSRAIIAHFKQRDLQARAGGSPLTEFEQNIKAGRNNAFTSPDETLAWALTNKDAQKYLESIPYKKTNAWTWFVDAVRNLLGLPSGAHTALAEVLRISDHLLEPDTINTLEPIAAATGTALARQTSKYEKYSAARQAAKEKESIYRHVDPRNIIHGYSPYVGVEMQALPKGSFKEAVSTAFAPASKAPGKNAAGIIRGNLGEQAYGREQALTKLESFAKMFDKFSPEDNYKFIDDIENGRAIENPRLNEAAAALRGMLDSYRDRVRALGTGALDNFNVNYFPHIYKDAGKAEAFFKGVLSKRSLEGGKGFLKQRKYDSLADAIKPEDQGGGGLTPITDNPVEMTLLKLREMDRYIYGQKIFKELKDAQLVKFYRPGQAPDGMVKINDKIGNVNSPAAEGGMIHRGDYYAPQEAATVINNHLSPGLAGNGFYDAFRGIGNAMNTAQLAFSLYHVGFTTLDAIVSKNALAAMQFRRGDIASGAKNLLMGTLGSPITPFLNLKNGDRLLKAYRGDVSDPAMAPLVEALQAAGARQRDDLYRNTTVNAFKQAARAGRYGEMALKAIPTMLDYMNKPVFEYLVPRQKFGVFFDMAQDAIKQNPNMDMATKRAVFGKIWDSVDNRMGELVYDNVFWNRALKDGLMATTRSVGWNLGTFRELGGGVLDAKSIFKDKSLSPRTAYVLALPFTTAIIGSAIQYLYTGKGPDDLKDCFFPRDGGVEIDGKTPSRKSLPSYIKDVAEYGHDIEGFIKYGSDPLHTVKNKLAPSLSTMSQMLSNEDFYGGAIRSPGDSAVRQADDVAAYLLKQIEPFSYRNYQQGKTNGPLGYLASPAFYGLSPAPGYVTKSAADQESQEVAKDAPALMKKFRESIKENGLQDDTIQRMIAAGLTPEQRKLILRNSSGAFHSFKPREFNPQGRPE
jgi:GGDEF domain-containing protein